MDELVFVMEEIRDLLSEMNSKLDNISNDINQIKGNGVYDSLADVCDKLDEIKGNGLYNNLSDVCDKLDSLDTTCSLIG